MKDALVDTLSAICMCYHGCKLRLLILIALIPGFYINKNREPFKFYKLL